MSVPAGPTASQDPVDEFAGLSAPDDPRSAHDRPRFGSLPPVSVLDELVTRVLAPNASLMTLDGTNTYLVGAAGSGEAAIVDPGPATGIHFDRVQRALADSAAECRWILVTHHHFDHSEAALDWAAKLGATVAAADTRVAGPSGRVLVGGDRIPLGSSTITVVATPGHCGDHLAFRLDSGALLVGDHILGRGTSVVAYPEGDLLAYLASLRRVLDLGPSALYPGHGPEMTEDPLGVVNYYLAHRLFREGQILALLARGPAEPAALVQRIYAGVDRALWPAAEQSTRTALVKLAAEGRVELDRGGTARLGPSGDGESLE